MLEGAKSIGAGAATIALAGAAVGIGKVFSSLIHSVARNPKQLFGYAILGFALTEAIALFALMRVLMTFWDILVFTQFFWLCLVLFSFCVSLESNIKNQILFLYFLNPKVQRALFILKIMFVVFIFLRIGFLIFENVSSIFHSSEFAVFSMFPRGGEGGNAGPSNRPLFDLNLIPEPEPEPEPKAVASSKVRNQTKELLRSFLQKYAGKPDSGPVFTGLRSCGYDSKSEEHHQKLQSIIIDLDKEFSTKGIQLKRLTPDSEVTWLKSRLETRWFSRR
jgi:F-type H+-transporting ATPase subunit c